MHRIWSKLTGLGWKWRLLLLALVVVIGVVVVAPGAYYLLRARNAPDYGDMLPKATMTYQVSYDSGDGLVNESTYTLKVVETDVAIGSDAGFYTVTEMDPLPERKVNAISRRFHESHPGSRRDMAEPARPPYPPSGGNAGQLANSQLSDYGEDVFGL